MAELFKRYAIAYILCIFLFYHQISTNDDFQSTKEATDHDINLHRLDGGKVGDVREILLDNAKFQMKTLSLEPLLFEIPNFLSAEECSHYIDLAQEEGLEDSVAIDRKQRFMIMDKDKDRKLNVDEMRQTIEGSMDVYLEEADILKMYEETSIDIDSDGLIDKAEMSQFQPPALRAYVAELLKTSPEKHSHYSQHAWLYDHISTDPMLASLKKRISKVVQLPLELIKRGDFQVVKYGEKGHYNAHWDSALVNNDIPCCTSEATYRCRKCRFMTVLVYLNEVEEGGETAFPVAGNETVDKMVLLEQQLMNLYKFCDKSKLKIKPELGKAVIWYNHFVDPESGWLGEMDEFSVHGSCNVKKGEQWIGNYWINVTDDKEYDTYRMFKNYQREEL